MEAVVLCPMAEKNFYAIFCEFTPFQTRNYSEATTPKVPLSYGANLRAFDEN